MHAFAQATQHNPMNHPRPPPIGDKIPPGPRPHSFTQRIPPSPRPPKAVLTSPHHSSLHRSSPSSLGGENTPMSTSSSHSNSLIKMHQASLSSHVVSLFVSNGELKGSKLYQLFNKEMFLYSPTPLFTPSQMYQLFN